MIATAERFQGVARLPVGDVKVAFELSGSLAIRNLEIGGILGEGIPTKALTKIANAFEGAPLDASILKQVAKRAFQENEIAVPGVRPEDVVAAILAA